MWSETLWVNEEISTSQVVWFCGEEPLMDRKVQGFFVEGSVERTVVGRYLCAVGIGARCMVST